MITSHRNYREYLKAKLAERISSNPRYSLRSFARSLGLAHSSLAEILSGKKNLSVERAVVIAEKLRLNPPDTEYFVQLIQYQNAKSESLKSMVLEKLNAINHQKQFFDLSIDHFKVIADWYHMPILFMTDLNDFTPNAENISKRLGISKIETEAALDRLARLNLISINEEGVITRTNTNILIKSSESNEALRSYHHQMIGLAAKSLDTHDQQHRFTSTRTFAINAADLPKLADATREYLAKVALIAEKSSAADQVFHAFVNIFQITDSKEAH